MFPNRLDFSRFQIERVRERNELTQCLINLNGMNVGGESYEAIYGAGRIAGEKGREYVLVKNDGVEGGWVLGVVGRKEGVVAPSRYHGEKHRPVIIGNDDDEEDEGEFEDVPIEGLNRLPKLSHAPMDKKLEDLERQQLRQAIYNSKRDQAGYRSHEAVAAQETDSRIGLEGEGEEPHRDFVVLSDDQEEAASDIEMIDALPQENKESSKATNGAPKGTHMTMGTLAEVVRAAPPVDGVHEKGKCHKDDRPEPSDEVEAHEVGQHMGKIDGELASKLGAARGKPLELPPRQPGIQEEIQTKDNTGSEEAAEAADALDQFSGEEDEELLQQLHKEVKEHARFASSLTKDYIPFASQQPKTTLTAEDYERELKALRNQRKKDHRDADEVTHTMISECQQLLTLFGLPYITAPMEAEAQCAELVRLELVDGIVTDDSDCFLFGGTRVYKNMFNQAKYVECYLLGDLEKEFSLDRKKLISLAHLLGSDYTDGLPSVGSVTALELLTEFSIEGVIDEEPVAPLWRFREWWEQVQHLAGVTYNDNPDSKFKKKFRKSHATKLYLPKNFPVADVDEAYLNPEVDQDPSTFQWGVPDLDGLRQFLMSTIGCTLSNITRYFDGSVGAGAFAPRKKEARKSKRMDQAMQKLHRIASKGNKGSSGPGGDGDDDSTAPTPISMKDAASGMSTPRNASVSRRKNKTGTRKQVNGGKRQTRAVSVSSSSGSETDSGVEQGVGSTESGNGFDAEPVKTGKKRKAAPSVGMCGGKKGGGRGSWGC
ncbi:hypothetical protein EV426DRAFT_705215 [Tirmania nivea]|nr:hypothetical protein EV426DRAFT_705215 [Tirmania nivea]